MGTPSCVIQLLINILRVLENGEQREVGQGNEARFRVKFEPLDPSSSKANPSLGWGVERFTSKQTPDTHQKTPISSGCLLDFQERLLPFAGRRTEKRLKGHSRDWTLLFYQGIHFLKEGLSPLNDVVDYPLHTFYFVN